MSAIAAESISPETFAQRSCAIGPYTSLCTISSSPDVTHSRLFDHRPICRPTTRTRHLCGRYSSKEMQRAQSYYHLAQTLALVILRDFTRCIITNTGFRLAEAEQELGLEGITDEALAQVRTALTIEDEEFALAADHERRVRHDVMVNFKDSTQWTQLKKSKQAHIHTVSQKAPAGKDISNSWWS